jgi:predicted TIM-barrel enzyme
MVVHFFLSTAKEWSCAGVCHFPALIFFDGAILWQIFCTD